MKKHTKYKIKYLLIFLLFVAVFPINSAKAADNSIALEILITQKRVTLNYKNQPLNTILKSIQKQSGVDFVIFDDLQKALSSITINVSNITVEEALTTILKNCDYTYRIENNLIKFEKKKIKQETSVKKDREIKGRVIDLASKNPIIGATILIMGSSRGAISDEEGKFILMAKDGEKIEVSFSGMIPQVTTITPSINELNVKLEGSVMEVEDVVVTGIFDRSKETFTGSSSTFTAKDLKKVGNNSILQSLKTLDPSFAIVENNQWGSDPNRLPDIEVRGKTSVVGLKQEYDTDPNQPLFILDGFESTLSIINDLSMDRVESITVLKDATATAIYGSKAANGVVVVVTKAPESGKFRISYNGNLSVSFADLSDYNLMNSAEKVQFERLAGYYGKLSEAGDILDEGKAKIYNARLAEVERGVDTYWMNHPLRVAATHRHAISAEGGDKVLRYGLGINYGKTNGVMKGSTRDVVNGNFRIMYSKGKINFSNALNIDYSNSQREAVAFSSFSKANPYFRKYNDLNEPERLLKTWIDPSSWDGVTDPVTSPNPIYDMNLNNDNGNSTFGFSNNFEFVATLVDGLRARARVGLGRSTDRTHNFKSPLHSSFVSEDFLLRGKYDESTTNTFNYNGDVSLTYGKVLGENHRVNAVAGMNFRQSNRQMSGFSVEGFTDDKVSNPGLAFGYSKDKTKPDYSDDKRRNASYYFSAGYSYDNRYMIDFSFRLDGASMFGLNNKFTQTWSMGLGWNIHNEKFIKENVKWMNTLKIRGSMGNPGNQNFSARMIEKIYSSRTDFSNPFGLGSVISSFGNNNLKWQQTLDTNVGLDLEVLNHRLRFNVDYFFKDTNPLLINIGTPSSTGTSQIATNFGGQITTGFTIVANYVIAKTNTSMWSVNANVRNLESEYRDMGTALDILNKENMESNKNFTRYYDGGSPTSIWAVRSLGIDPSTGKEVFLTKQGKQTFRHDYADEVVVGNTAATLEGVIGSSYRYKNFSASVNFRYRIGGQQFLSAIYSKVENISKDALQYNQDKRAYYDRWQKPGDVAKFKAINLDESTPMSSRFVADDNSFSCESVSLSYDHNGDWLKAIGVSSLSMSFYLNDIFRISTIKEERGIDYPFARSFSFSLGLRF